MPGALFIRRCTFVATTILTLGILLSGALLFPGCETETSAPPVDECAITVQAPNGGEIWIVGDSANIAWDTEDACGDYVRLTLLNNGDSCLVIGDSVGNEGTHQWQVIRCGEEPSGYAVRIIDLLSAEYDDSDTTFAIVTEEDACTPTITFPNGGESILLGSTITIAWECTGDCGDSVAIELLRDGGLCEILTAAAANVGSFAWTTTQCDGEEDGYTIRLTDTATGNQDVSDAEFSITTTPMCELTVIYPNGGETIVVGDDVEITWESSGICGDSVAVELLLEGVLYETLAAAAPSSGSLSWTAVQYEAAEEGYAIRVTDGSTGVSDKSDTTFSILGALPECELTLTTPSGGWYCEDDPVTIEWTATGSCGDAVVIELLREGTFCNTIASAPNSGSYVWSAAPCDGESDGYTVRITDSTSGGSAESAEAFAIYSGCLIVMVSPEEGETLCAGDSVTIGWSHGPCCGSEVAIQLLLDNQICATIATAATNNGNYTWIAEQCNAATDGYTIRVTDSDTGTAAETDEFSILVCDCQIEVGFPDGGEVFQIDEQVGIIWMASDSCGSEVTIELLRSGTVCETIASSAPNTGAYEWTAAQCDTDSSDYTIRVSDPASGNSDVSEAPFFITSAPPECVLSLITPNDGETYCVGQTVPISWGDTDPCGAFVRIELYLNGSLCLPIAPSTANDGLFEWSAQQCDFTEAGYTVRITDIESGFFDHSDGSFTISPPCVITVSNPNGGESYCEGESAQITWVAGGCCGENAKIELLRGGQLCEMLAESTPNDGSYTWSPEQCDGHSAGYIIRVTDLDSGMHDDSGASFSIRPPCGLNVLYPAGGEAFCVGDTIAIAWYSTDCCGATVMVELLRDGAVCWEIAGSTENSGLLEWVAGQCSGETHGYSIRVTDLDSETSAAGGSFAIHPECPLALLSPNGGETLCIDAGVEITWTFNDCCGEHVTIELLQGDSPCLTIDPAADNVGEYLWTVESCLAGPGNYKIRLTDPAAGVSDASDGDFAIAEPCSLEMTYPLGGEMLHEADEVAITWNASDCCGANVRIELLHEGLVCLAIANLTANDGSFNWTAAQCANHITGYTVRISDTQSEHYDETTEIWIAPENTLIVCAGEPHDHGTIQAAIDAADPNDLILLCDGTYTGTGNRDLDFGGKAITVRSMSNDPELCIIDCQGDPDSHRGFYFHSGEGNDSVVEALTVRDGYDAADGGAVYCRNGSAPRFVDCIFIDNGCGGDGGAIYCSETAFPRFLVCVFETNDCHSDGGAVYCIGATAHFTNCTFAGNSALAWGGAVYCSSSPAALEFTDCAFTTNIAEFGGAFVTNNHATPPVFTGCTFTGNSSYDAAGAIYWSGPGGTLTNCTFTGNKSDQAGAILIYSPLGLVTLTGCQFTNNEATWVPRFRSGNHAGGMGNEPLGGRNIADRCAGAVECWHSAPEFVNCAFSGNSADDAGGAVGCFDSADPSFSGCDFETNSAYNGGGLFSRDSAFGLIDCDFTGNEADSSGGAIHAQATTAPTLSGCTFTGNSTLEIGGAAYFVDNTGAQLTSCDFLNNQSGFVGGALCCELDSNANLDNCTFTGNTAPLGGALASTYCLPGLENCTFSGNTAETRGGAYYCINTLAPPGLTNCTFSGNSAPEGGAVMCAGLALMPTMLTLIGCDFEQNSASTGGALLFTAADTDLSGCTFTGNVANIVRAGPPGEFPDGPGSTVWIGTGNGPLGGRSELYYGGAVYCEDATSDFAGCTFTSNDAEKGGGVSVYSSGSTTMSGCDFISNTADHGGGIHCFSGSINLTSCAFSTNVIDSCGAGVYCNQPLTTPLLTLCTFSSNDAGHYGGGVYLYETATASVDQCDFLSNSAHQGGGIYCRYSSPALTDVTLDGNSASDHGGGLCCWTSSSPSLANCALTGNSATGSGGGIFASLNCHAYLDSCEISGNSASRGAGCYFVYTCNPIVEDCVIYNNTSTEEAGGFYFSNTCSPILSNCTICGNSAGTNGGGLHLTDGSSAILDQSIISHSVLGEAAYCDGTSSITAGCCDVYGNDGGDWVGCLSGQGGTNNNFSADPLYCNLGLWDLTLDDNSPCTPANSPCGFLVGALGVACTK